MIYMKKILLVCVFLAIFVLVADDDESYTNKLFLPESHRVYAENSTKSSILIESDRDLLVFSNNPECTTGSEKFLKVKVDKIVGWIDGFNAIQLPVKAYTRLMPPPSNWKLYLSPELKTVIGNYTPDMEVIILDIISIDNILISEVQLGEVKGWLQHSFLKIVSNQEIRVEDIYKLNNFHENQSDLNSFLSKLQNVSEVTLKRDDYYTVISGAFGENSFSIIESSNGYRLNSMNIKSSDYLPYGLKVGINIDQLNSILGKKYRIVDGRRVYSYTIGVLSNELFGIHIKVENDIVVDIELIYYLFD